jgi:hypothetical protein
VIDMFTDQVIAEVDHEHTFAVSLEPHQGLSLVTTPAAPPDPLRHRQHGGDAVAEVAIAP